jgi:rsbT antagonist protein RsbS
MHSGYHLTLIGGGDFLLDPTRALDVSQGDRLIEEIAARLAQANPSRLYYDLAELPLIDLGYYRWLNQLARACDCLNVRLVCIHMQPTAAFALAHRLKEPPRFETALDVAGSGPRLRDAPPLPE